MKKPTILSYINILREKSETVFELNYLLYFILIVGVCMEIVCSEHCFQVSAGEILSSRGFPTFEVSFDCTINGLSKVHCKWFNFHPPNKYMNC